MENNLPAFPLVVPEGDWHRPGLSQRELIAAMALQGLLANPDYNCPSRPKDMATETGTAIAALRYTDALLYELSKPQP